MLYKFKLKNEKQRLLTDSILFGKLQKTRLNLIDGKLCDEVFQDIARTYFPDKVREFQDDQGTYYEAVLEDAADQLCEIEISPKLKNNANDVRSVFIISETQ